MTDKLNREELIELAKNFKLPYPGAINSNLDTGNVELSPAHFRNYLESYARNALVVFCKSLSARQEQAEPGWNEAIETIATSFVHSFREDDRLDPAYIAECILSHKRPSQPQEPIKASANDLQRIEAELREQAHEYRQADASVGMFADPETADMFDEFADRIKALFIAQPAALNNPVEVEFAKKEAIANIIKQISELPEKTGPLGCPGAMLVTANELRDILEDVLVPVAQPAAPEEQSRIVAYLERTMRCGVPAVEAAARICYAFYEGAEISEPAAQTVVPEGLIQVSVERIQNAAAHAKLAADCIVGMAKAKPGNMCGWLDDACTSADIAHDVLRKLLADAAPQPVATQAGELLGWAIGRWTDEVANRPLINVHRRTLDSTWRQVIKYAGGDDVLLIGPRHDDLVASAADPQAAQANKDQSK
jgi:hypothetical protein